MPRVPDDEVFKDSDSYQNQQTVEGSRPSNVLYTKSSPMQSILPKHSATTALKVKTESCSVYPRQKERNWTEDENVLLLSVIVNGGHMEMLDMLASKRASNAEVFHQIKQQFDREANRLIKTNGPLDTSVEKLRKKYSNLKAEHKRLCELIHSGNSHLVVPKWFKILSTKTVSEELLMRDSCGSQDEDSMYAPTSDIEDEESDPNDLSDRTKRLHENHIDTSDEPEPIDVNQKRKKPNRIKSQPQQTLTQTQVLADLARSIDRNGEFQKQQLESEQKRHKEYLKFKKEEGEKVRAHELEIAKIYANAMIFSPQALPAPISNSGSQRKVASSSISRPNPMGYLSD